MKGKASDICTMCKHCEGLDMFAKMYSCKHYNNYPDAAIGVDCEIECDNFEEVNMNKVEGKVGDFCPKCKNGSVIVWKGVSNIVCEDPYDGMIKILAADNDICCSMFEIRTEKKEKESCDKISLLQHELEMEKLRMKIHQLEKEKAAHMKGIERLKKSQEKLQNQVKNLQTTNEESYKRKEKLEDKVHKLERRLLEENKRFSRLDTEFLMPLAHVLYPREAKICKPYSEVLKDIKLLNKGVYDLKEDNKRLADKDKALFEENIDRLDKHTKQCQEIDNLKNELKKANELAESWKRDYERLRDQFIYPIYNILYPDEVDLNINVTDLLNDVKNLKVYSEENGTMYKEIQEWREKCIARGDEISKLQNIVTEKEVEIKGLKTEIVHLGFNRAAVKDIIKKNTKLNQTISDQEITIKALLITIKEMCKEENENA